MRAAAAAVARPYVDDNTDGDDCDDDDRDDDKPLAKTSATREEKRNTSRLMVYCGSSKGEFHQSKPGNVAYLDAVRSRQGAYQWACREQDSAQQANILDDIAAQFDFVRRPTTTATAAGGNNDHEWQLAPTEWIQEKIQKALVGLTKNGRATKVGSSSSVVKVPVPSTRPSTTHEGTLAGRKKPMKPTQQQRLHGHHKVRVDCDRALRNSSGNAAYYQYIASIQGPYRIAAVDSKIRKDLVAVQERFDFYQDGRLANDLYVRHKIQNALADPRYAKRGFHVAVTESPRGNVVVPKRFEVGIHSTAARGQREKSVPSPPNNEAGTSSTNSKPERAVVYCGQGFRDRPGNIAFVDCITLFSKDYVAADVASQERAALVDRVRQRFDFVQVNANDSKDVVLADESFVQEKIRRALSDSRWHGRHLKRQRTGEGNESELSKVARQKKPRHHPDVQSTSQASASREEVQQQGKEKIDLDEHAEGSGIPVVYCGSSSFSQGPGNDAYGELVLASRPKYWAVDSTEEDRVKIVASIMKAFNFQRPTDATGLRWVTASSTWTHQKVQCAIDDTRHDREAAALKAARSRGSSMSAVATRPEKSVLVAPLAARSKVAAATPNTIHEMLRQCPFLTGKPVVFCAFASWKISPGNVAYANAITAQCDLYRAADMATRESIVDAILAAL